MTDQELYEKAIAERELREVNNSLNAIKIAYDEFKKLFDNEYYYTENKAYDGKFEELDSILTEFGDNLDSFIKRLVE